MQLIETLLKQTARLCAAVCIPLVMTVCALAQEDGVSYKIYAGKFKDKTVSSLLKGKGLPEKTVAAIKESMSGLIDQSDIDSEDSFELINTRDGRFVKLTAKHGGKYYNVLMGKDGKVYSKKTDSPVSIASAEKPEPEAAAKETKSRIFSGSLNGKSLYSVMKSKGITEPELSAINSAMDRIIDTRKLFDDDSYELVTADKGDFSKVAVRHGAKRYTVQAEEDGGYDVHVTSAGEQKAAKPAEQVAAQPQVKEDKSARQPAKKEQEPVKPEPKKQEPKQHQSSARIAVAPPAANASGIPFKPRKNELVQLNRKDDLEELDPSGETAIKEEPKQQPAKPVAKPEVKPEPAAKPKAEAKPEPVQKQDVKDDEDTGSSARVISAKLDGRPVYLVMKKNGIKEPELSRINDALDKAINTKKLYDEDYYELSFGQDGSFARLEIKHRGKFYYVTKKAGKYSVKTSSKKIQSPQDSDRKKQSRKDKAPADARQDKQAKKEPAQEPAAKVKKQEKQPAKKDVKESSEEPAKKAKGADRQSKQDIAAPAKPEKKGVKADEDSSSAETEARIIKGKTKGLPLYIILKKNGIKEPELTGINTALAKILNLKKMWDKDTYELALGSSGKFVRLTVKHGPATYSVTKENGKLTAKRGTAKAKEDVADNTKQEQKQDKPQPKPAEQKSAIKKPEPVKPQPLPQPISKKQETMPVKPEQKPVPAAQPKPVAKTTMPDTSTQLRKGPEQPAAAIMPSQNIKPADDTATKKKMDFDLFSKAEQAMDTFLTAKKTDAAAPKAQQAAAPKTTAGSDMPCDMPMPQQGDKVATGQLPDKPLYSILRDNGIAEPELSGIMQSITTIISPKMLHKGDGYQIVQTSAGKLRHLNIFHNGKCYSVLKDKNGALKAQKSEIPLKPETKKAEGAIKNSLWASLASAGVTAPTILEYTDIFSGEVDFLTELQDGDRFALTWEENSSPDGKVQDRKILSATYSGKQSGARSAYFFEGQYYNEKGESMVREFLKAPLHYRRISSTFTSKRFHPVLKYYRPHYGIDYAAPVGTPVSTVANGVVAFVGTNGGFGKYVEIRHGEYTTSYGHLSRFASKLKKGSRVDQGDVIGYVGATGIATGPHLDFRIKKDGKFFNYLTMKDRGDAKKLSNKKMAKFMELVKAYSPRYEMAGFPRIETGR